MAHKNVEYFKEICTNLSENWRGKFDASIIDLETKMSEVTFVQENQSQNPDSMEILGKVADYLPENRNPFTKITSPLVKLFPYLKWSTDEKRLGKDAKFCELISAQNPEGCFGISKDIQLGLIFIPTGKTVPQNAESLDTLLQVLTSENASPGSIGNTEDYLNAIEPGRVYHFAKTEPKVIQASNKNPVLALYLKANASRLETHLDKSVPTEVVTRYSEDIMKIPDIHQYYIDFADDYDAVMKAWGYFVPDLTADKLIAHGNLQGELAKIKVLDLGCGSGLTGLALKRKGFSIITGVDLSTTMCEKSRERGIYEEVINTDLLQKLPFEDNSFDLLICTAVTTYIEPKVLRDWIRVAKPGSKICFTHKTSIQPPWEAEQEILEKQGVWKKVWINLGEEIPYLPSLKEDGVNACKEMTRIYIYETC